MGLLSRQIEANSNSPATELQNDFLRMNQALAQSVGTSGKVHGVDISDGMIDITRQRLNKVKLLDRVELKCGDATNLPYKSSIMDAVFMSFALELFDTPEIPIVLRECQRVLKTDGRICVVALSKVSPL